MNEGNLPTLLDLAGTLQPVRTMDDIAKIVVFNHSLVCTRTSPTSPREVSEGAFGTWSVGSHEGISGYLSAVVLLYS